MKIKIAHIATKNSSNEISSLGTIDFCLLPYLDKYEEYNNYFKRGKGNRKFVICDDSIAENGGAMKPQQFVKKALEVKPNELIVPDVIGNYKLTKKKREMFLDKYYDTLTAHNIKLMGVIQGETIDEYEKSLHEVQSDRRIATVGLPFRMNFATFRGKTKEENHMYNRLLFLNTHIFFKPVHCLGVNLPKEIESLKYIETVRSCDSKLMCRYGYNEQIMNFKDKIKPKKKVQVDDEMTEKQIEIAILNITKLEEKLKW